MGPKGSDDRKTILMAVFNPIEFDGRVKRAAETLNRDYRLLLFCPFSPTAPELSLSSEFQIWRAWLPWKRWPTAISLAFFWLQFIYVTLVTRPRIVYSHDYYLPFPGLLAARCVHALSIYDAHELIIPSGQGQMSRRDRMYYWFEKVSVVRHDLVIAANRERAELMKQHYQLQTLPTIIRNICEPTLGSVERTVILGRYPELSRKGKEFFVAYMGDVALERGLGAVIDAFEYLPKDVSLVVVGDGPDRIGLEQKYSSEVEGRKPIRFLGAIPQIWIQDVLSLCDIGIIVYSMQGLNNYFCAPNKIFEYTHAGLPVVSTPQPPLRAMIDQYRIGKVATTNEQSPTPTEFASAIWDVLSRHAEFSANIKPFLQDNSINAERERLIHMSRAAMIEKFGKK